jgi:hypothetical protein
LRHERRQHHRQPDRRHAKGYPEQTPIPHHHAPLPCRLTGRLTPGAATRTYRTAIDCRSPDPSGHKYVPRSTGVSRRR